MPAATAHATNPVMEPIRPAERIVIIDVLRGVALLGILVVNMELFSSPIQTILLPLAPTVSAVDRAADWVVRFAGEGKFYTLFSLLFGLGFALQMKRAEERGVRPGPVYARRLITLLVIGLVHGFLIWVGDILVLYSLLGFPLLLYRKAKPKTLLIWTVVLLAIPLAFNVLGTVGVEMGRMAGPQVAAKIDQSFAEQDSSFRADTERAYQVYPNGSFAEITRQRAHDMAFAVFGYLFMAPNILAMFLVGMYFGRRGLFENLEDHLPFFRRLLWWGLALGVVGNGIFATLIQSLPRAQPSATLLVASLGQTVGAPALALFYLSALTLISRRALWKERMRPLASVGRIPLSTYLAESIICTLIFYGYGLGLFGQVGEAVGVLLAIAIYCGLVLLSLWWTRRFRFGPAEWLWRSLTYWNVQPMRQEANGTSPPPIP